VSGNTEIIEFNPSSVRVEEHSVKKVRGLAGEESIHNKRAYGLAIEFANTRMDEFRRYVSDREGLE